MAASEIKEEDRTNRVRRGWRRWAIVLLALLLVSVVINLTFWWQYDQYYAGSEPPAERFVKGDAGAAAKIARIEIIGTIMPPFTERILNSLQRAGNDPAVKGVLLVIDSPGGLVADSHEIYHQLAELRAKKPVFASMRRIAASGGLYVAMGVGPEGLIFAEPTTWTGSIGVIIPRVELTGLAEKIGIAPGSLKTGPMKDSLNPLRPLTDKEKQVWSEILNESFDRFIRVIAENRAELDEAEVRDLATGRILTATQSLKAGLVDRIGYEEKALAALQKKLGLQQVRVVAYDFPTTLLDLIIPFAQAADPQSHFKAMLDRSAPQALYYCGGRLPLTEILDQLP